MIDHNTPTSKLQRKILLVDFAYLGAEGGVHLEAYYLNILHILLNHYYHVFIATGNNIALKRYIQENQIKNCQVVDFELGIVDKVWRRIFLLADTFISVLTRSKYKKFSSIINLLNTKKILNRIDHEMPVFFTHAESIMPLLSTVIVGKYLPKQWVGLCVLPSYKAEIYYGLRKKEQMYQSEMHFAHPSCKAILVLNPLYKSYFTERFQENKFIYLPELINQTNTNVDNREVDSQMITEVKSLARGRKIVAFLGKITPRKNLALFLNAVRQIDPEKLFILIVGKIVSHTEDELKLIHHLIQDQEVKSNSYIRTDYFIRNESEFSSLIELSDILFLHYRDHPFSSNILAKAMAMKKPVIVNEGYLMDQVVKQYHWGAITKPDDKIIASEIKLMIDTNFQICESNYQRFMHEHSYEQFEATITKVAASMDYD